MRLSVSVVVLGIREMTTDNPPSVMESESVLPDYHRKGSRFVSAKGYYGITKRPPKCRQACKTGWKVSWTICNS